MEVNLIQNQPVVSDNSVQRNASTTYASAASSTAHCIIDELTDRQKKCDYL